MCARLFTAITRHKLQTISWFFTGTVVLVWSGVVATDRGLGQMGQLSVLGALALPDSDVETVWLEMSEDEWRQVRIVHAISGHQVNRLPTWLHERMQSLELNASRIIQGFLNQKRKQPE